MQYWKNAKLIPSLSVPTGAPVALANKVTEGISLASDKTSAFCSI